MTLKELKTRAKRHDMMIRKDGKGNYLLVNIGTNIAAAPGPMTLDQVEAWLDDVDKLRQKQIAAMEGSQQ